jgi:hypothetical protein
MKSRRGGPGGGGGLFSDPLVVYVNGGRTRKNAQEAIIQMDRLETHFPVGQSRTIYGQVRLPYE